ncbi:MAG: ATP-binding cassette domain-containing protein, partial [Planctomycetes bacterium]|nr:ATP-binding cassette domain-containing protein [Planctomycetota bacterium]
MSKAMIEVRQLSKSYRMGRIDLHVLKKVSLSVGAGEFVAVVGASGSGKSTLLHLIGLLDRPDGGSIALDGVDAAGLSARGRNRIRRGDVGFVFQFYHLLPELNVLENVLIAAMTGTPVLKWLAGSRQARRAARELLEMLGLGRRLGHRPRELSGGERQRVAIARAL